MAVVFVHRVSFAVYSGNGKQRATLNLRFELTLPWGMRVTALGVQHVKVADIAGITQMLMVNRSMKLQKAVARIEANAGSDASLPSLNVIVPELPVEPSVMGHFEQSLLRAKISQRRQARWM